MTPRWKFLIVTSLLQFALDGWACAQAKPVVVTLSATTLEANNEGTRRMLAQLKLDTGIELQLVIKKESDVADEFSVTVGQSIDIVRLSNSNVQEIFTRKGLILPLDELATRQGASLEKIYGKYLTWRGGRVFYLPYEVSMQALFYNKKIFDAAKAPYPRAGWSWDDYIATAKQLTSQKTGIYGSFMENWDYFLYLRAHQRGVPDYKKDGSANFDHPAFKEALSWFKDLGEKHQIQPSWVRMVTDQVRWDAMMGGKYAMTLIGCWQVNLFTGVIPALASMDAQTFRRDFRKFCEDNLRGDITVDELCQAILGNGLGMVAEKVVGPAGAAINAMYFQEAEKYLVGARSLDETMRVIKAKADELIRAQQ